MYNNMSYFVITEIRDVGGLKWKHEGSKYLRTLSLKIYNMSANWICIWNEHAYILYNLVTILITSW